MSKRTPIPSPDWESIYSLLITRYRKLMKLPIGPLDRLQTREFRHLIEHVQKLSSHPNLEDKDLLAAYLMYQWPIHYAQALSLIQELPIKPTRVLDLGAKAAPFSLAALQWGAKEAIAIDTQELALKYAADLCGHIGHPISIRTHDYRLTRQLPVEGKWDLIVLGYSLFSRLQDPQTQADYVQELLFWLSETGFILIVEDSSLETNRRFLTLRDEIAARNIPIQAPCIWKGNCPALKHGSSPCFAQRPFSMPWILREIQRAADIHLSSLKMSYLILSAQPTHTKTPPLYRVVSPPVKTHQGSRFFLCGSNGKKTLGSSLSEIPPQAKAFSYIQRGDVLQIEGAQETGQDFEIVKDSTVRLYAPCDKPIV